jgi:hypothetical protein
MSGQVDEIVAELSDADRKYLYIGWGQNFVTRTRMSVWRCPGPGPSGALLALRIAYVEYLDAGAGTFPIGVSLTELGQQVVQALVQMREAEVATGRHVCRACKGEGKMRGFRGVTQHCLQCEGTGLR